MIPKTPAASPSRTKRVDLQVDVIEPSAAPHAALMVSNPGQVLAGGRRKVLIFSDLVNAGLKAYAEDLDAFCRRRGDDTRIVSAKNAAGLTPDQKAFLEIDQRPAVDLQGPSEGVVSSPLYRQNTEMARHLGLEKFRLLARTNGSIPCARKELFDGSDAIGVVDQEFLMNRPDGGKTTRHHFLQPNYVIVARDRAHSEALVEDLSLAHVFMLENGKEKAGAFTDIARGQERNIIFHPGVSGNALSSFEQDLNAVKPTNIFGVAKTKHEVASFLREIAHQRRPHPPSPAGAPFSPDRPGKPNGGAVHAAPVL